MNVRTTVVVLLLAVALAAYFVVVELDMGRGGDAEPAPIDQAGRTLWDPPIESSAIDHLAITWANGESVALERDADGGGWMQTDPVVWPADAPRLDRLADDVADLRYFRKLAADAKPASYGLSPAKATLTIRAGESEHTVALGRTGAAGRAFAQVDGGDAIYVVNPDLHEQTLDASVNDLRRRSLVDLPQSHVRRVTLSVDDKPIAVAQRDGRWTFAEGASGRVDQDAIESVISAFAAARVGDFVADQPVDLARYGLAEPATVLTVQTADPDAPASDEATHRLAIGSPHDFAGESYNAMLDDTPVVFTLPKASVEAIKVTVDKLRDPRLVTAVRSEVRGITIERPEHSAIQIQFSEGRWVFGENDPGYGVEQAAVSGLMDQLLGARASSFSEAFDAASLVATVRLTVANEPDPEVLRLAQPDADQPLQARRGDETVTYLIDRSALSKLFDPALAYRDRKVWELHADDLASIKVVHAGPDGVRHELVRDENGDWKTEGLDVAAVDRLVSAVAPLRAESWSTQPPPDAFDVTVTVTTKDGQSHAVELASEQLLGRTEAGLFALTKATMGALTGELRDRVVIGVDVEQMRSVTVGDLTIRRDADGRYRAEGDAAIDEDKAGQLFDALAGLRAERYLAGPPEVDADRPSVALTVAAEGDRSFALSMWRGAGAGAGEPPIGRVNGGLWFTLDAATAERIATLTGSVRPGP